jgi:hypothetical protein
MQDTKAAIDLAAPQATMYWVIFTASIQVQVMSQRLMDAGLAHACITFLVHAALAMESHTALRTPRFLHWCVTLIATLCAAYQELGAQKLALAFIDRTLNSISALEKRMEFDPVAVSADCRQQIRASQERLAVLRGGCELTMNPIPSGMGHPAMTNQQTNAQITSFLAAFWTPKRRALEPVPSQSQMHEIVKALQAVVLPLATAMVTEIKSREDVAMAEKEVKDVNVAMSEISSFSQAFVSAAAALPPEQHMRCMCTFHAAQDWASVESMEALTSARCTHYGDLCTPNGQILLAIAPLLRTASALSALDVQERRSEVFKSAAVELVQWVPIAKGHPLVCELLEDVGLSLWHAARPLLDGVSCMGDREADLVTLLLEALHAAFEGVQQDDEILRCANKKHRSQRQKIQLLCCTMLHAQSLVGLTRGYSKTNCILLAVANVRSMAL